MFSLHTQATSVLFMHTFAAGYELRLVYKGGLPFIFVMRPLGLQVLLRFCSTCPTSAEYKHNTTTNSKAPTRNGPVRQLAPCHSTAVVYSVHLQAVSVAIQLPPT
jgi:hypothetical protein